MIEVRAGTIETASPGRLTGYAATFNSEARIGDFSEVIRAGAFTRSLASDINVRALYHHQGEALLGTTRAGTLKLREDAFPSIEAKTEDTGEILCHLNTCTQGNGNWTPDRKHQRIGSSPSIRLTTYNAHLIIYNES